MAYLYKDKHAVLHQNGMFICVKMRIFYAYNIFIHKSMPFSLKKIRLCIFQEFELEKYTRMLFGTIARMVEGPTMRFLKATRTRGLPEQ